MQGAYMTGKEQGQMIADDLLRMESFASSVDDIMVVHDEL